MRAYGIPQAAFAIECLMDDVAAEIHMDPLGIPAEKSDSGIL